MFVSILCLCLAILFQTSQASEILSHMSDSVVYEMPLFSNVSIFPEAFAHEILFAECRQI